MMGFFRVAIRLVMLAAWTLVVFAWRLAAALVLSPLAPSLDKAVREFIFRLWGKGTLALYGVRVTVEGRPPKRPFYLVSNHLTYLDVILLGSLLGCVFVSRADVEHWPVLGFITKRMNTIYVDRAQPKDTLRVIELIGDAIDRGYGVHVFAEGGIGPGDAIQQFKPALLEPAIRKGCPVHYAVIMYSTPEGCLLASRAVVWRQGVSFMAYSMGLLRLPRVYATVKFGSEPIAAKDRKELAERLWQAAQEQFAPLT